MPKLFLTYLDTNVIVRAARAAHELEDELVSSAWRLLSDSRRRFVVSPLHELELLPGTRGLIGRLPPNSVRRRRVELELLFYEDYLNSAALRLPLAEPIVATAMELAESSPGLGAADALHAATAKHAGAELITTERVGTPLFRLADPDLRVTHLGKE